MSSPSPDRRVGRERDPERDELRRAALLALAEAEADRARQYARRTTHVLDLSDVFEGQHPRELQLHVAGICRMGQDSAGTLISHARRLRSNFPQALALLGRGEMFVRTVEILLQVTVNASDEVQAEVGRRALPEIVTWDAVDVRHRIAQLLPEVEAELEEGAQRRRHERAKANRGMWLLPLPDGMARIGVETDLLSAAQFATAFEEIDRAEAERDRRDGLKRTAGQRRADLFTELPARCLALVEALRAGNGEVLLAEAAARNAEAAAARAAAALGAQPAVQDELPLGVPPAGPARAWQLEAFELQVQLLRIPVNAQPVLNLHVPVTTVCELDQRAMRLDMSGYAYLPAFHARMLLPDAGLRRVLVDAGTGIPVAVDAFTWPRPDRPLHVELPDSAHAEAAVAARRARSCGCLHDDTCRPTPVPAAAVKAARDRERAWREQQRRLVQMITDSFLIRDEAEPRHDPSKALVELIRLRDQTSRGIGCNVLARRADLDHRHDHAHGGATAAWNLDAQGKRAHHSKDNGWTVTKDHQTGVITWTSPLGFTFTRQPIWRPPSPVDPDTPRPELNPPPLPTEPRDRPEPEVELPLWRDPKLPPPPKAGRSRTLDEITGLYDAQPPRPGGPAPKQQWGSDGPPPF